MEETKLLKCPWCREEPDVLKGGGVGHACYVLDRELRGSADEWNEWAKTGVIRGTLGERGADPVSDGIEVS